MLLLNELTVADAGGVECQTIASEHLLLKWLNLKYLEHTIKVDMSMALFRLPSFPRLIVKLCDLFVN